MMEMYQVRYFLAAARLLNFTRAAEECHVSQPSLTKAIQRLEEEFGAPLFRRERALTHLTELGKAMQPHLERTFAAAEAARQLAANIGKAQVAPLALGVSCVVDHPALHAVLREIGGSLAGLQLDWTVGSCAELVDAAMAGQLDVVLLALPQDAPERFEAWPLYDDRWQIVIGGAHDWAGAATVTPEQIVQEAWIDLAGDGCAALVPLARRAGDLRIAHRVRTRDAVAQLVNAGLGCGWLPRGLVPEGLVACSPAPDAPVLQVVVATVAGRRRAPAAEAFLRAARARAWTPVPALAA